MDKLKDTVRHVEELLVRGAYLEIETLTGGVRLSSDEIKGAVEQYGRILTMPPSEEFNRFDVVEIENSDPRRWSVRCNLWTAEEGRSDLSLDLMLEEAPGRLMRVELNDIRVL